MEVEISEEELEALEVAISFAIKGSAFMQMAAIVDPTNAVIKIDDILNANEYMKKSLDFVNKAKETAKK